MYSDIAFFSYDTGNRELGDNLVLYTSISISMIDDTQQESDRRNLLKGSLALGHSFLGMIHKDTRSKSNHFLSYAWLRW